MNLLSTITGLFHKRKETPAPAPTFKRSFNRAERRWLAKDRARLYSAAMVRKGSKLPRKERRRMGRAYAAYNAMKERQAIVNG